MNIEQRIFVGGVKNNLLGEDFYVKYKCVPTEGKRINYIFCTETVQVPGDHEAITCIPSKLTYTEEINGLPLPMQSFVVSHQMTVTKAILNAKTGVVFIRVFNPGEKPRLIKRGTLISSFIPVEYVSEAIENCCDEVSTVNEENSEMPQHLKAVYDDGCYHLTAEESKKFKEFLIRRERVFANQKEKWNGLE